MNLSDLLLCEVFDRDGTPVGRVRDVRLVQDAPGRVEGDAGLRVDGLVVGSTAVATRLGYDRAATAGPWLVRWLATVLSRNGRYVPWDRVSGPEDGRLDFAGTVDELGPIPPLPR